MAAQTFDGVLAVPSCVDSHGATLDYASQAFVDFFVISGYTNPVRTATVQLPMPSGCVAFAGVLCDWKDDDALYVTAVASSLSTLSSAGFSGNVMKSQLHKYVVTGDGQVARAWSSDETPLMASAYANYPALPLSTVLARDGSWGAWGGNIFDAGTGKMAFLPVGNMTDPLYGIDYDSFMTAYTYFEPSAIANCLTRLAFEPTDPSNPRVEAVTADGTIVRSAVWNQTALADLTGVVDDTSKYQFDSVFIFRTYKDPYFNVAVRWTYLPDGHIFQRFGYVDPDTYQPGNFGPLVDTADQGQGGIEYYIDGRVIPGPDSDPLVNSLTPWQTRSLTVPGHKSSTLPQSLSGGYFNKAANNGVTTPGTYPWRTAANRIAVCDAAKENTFVVNNPTVVAEPTMDMTSLSGATPRRSWIDFLCGLKTQTVADRVLIGTYYDDYNVNAYLGMAVVGINNQWLNLIYQQPSVPTPKALAITEWQTLFGNVPANTFRQFDLSGCHVSMDITYSLIDTSQMTGGFPPITAKEDPTGAYGGHYRQASLIDPLRTVATIGGATRTIPFTNPNWRDGSNNDIGKPVIYDYQLPLGLTQPATPVGSNGTAGSVRVEYLTPESAWVDGFDPGYDENIPPAFPPSQVYVGGNNANFYATARVQIAVTYTIKQRFFGYIPPLQRPRLGAGRLPGGGIELTNFTPNLLILKKGVDGHYAAANSTAVVSTGADGYERNGLDVITAIDSATTPHLSTSFTLGWVDTSGTYTGYGSGALTHEPRNLYAFRPILPADQATGYIDSTRRLFTAV